MEGACVALPAGLYRRYRGRDFVARAGQYRYGCFVFTDEPENEQQLGPLFLYEGAVCTPDKLRTAPDDAPWDENAPRPFRAPEKAEPVKKKCGTCKRNVRLGVREDRLEQELRHVLRALSNPSGCRKRISRLKAYKKRLEKQIAARDASA